MARVDYLLKLRSGCLSIFAVHSTALHSLFQAFQLYRQLFIYLFLS